MTPYRQLIETAALAHKLDPNLVEAVVMAESSGFTDAFRFEPGFYARYLLRNPAYAGQNPRRISSSYGLMQVMFTTAKENGFDGPPEQLFVPEVGLEYGCWFLAHLLEWSGGNVGKAVAAYNGGKGNWRAEAPQKYATKVLGLLRSVEAEQRT